VSTVENRLNQKLKVWGMNIDGFCILAHLCGALPLLSKSGAQRALAGTGPGFGAEPILALNALARDIDAIIQAAHPLPLNLKNPAVISELVLAWRNGSLTIDVQQHNQ
jgi:hypothetical protein